MLDRIQERGKLLEANAFLTDDKGALFKSPLLHDICEKLNLLTEPITAPKFAMCVWRLAIFLSSNGEIAPPRTSFLADVTLDPEIYEGYRVSLDFVVKNATKAVLRRGTGDVHQQCWAPQS